MSTLFSFVVFLLAGASFAFSSPAGAQSLVPADLRPGDVLVQSLACWSCSLIEIEEGAPYSHSSVVLDPGRVAQALNGVEIVPLDRFLAYRRGGTLTLVRRARAGTADFAAPRFERVLRAEFLGHPFDDRDLWEEPGTPEEAFYCSEFVAKFLNRFLAAPIATKPMHFDRHRADWERYFGGSPPDGAPGVSPADLARTPRLETIGTL